MSIEQSILHYNSEIYVKHIAIQLSIYYSMYQLSSVFFTEFHSTCVHI